MLKCENVGVNSETDFCTERANLCAAGAKLGVYSNLHCICQPSSLKKTFPFSCPFKSFLLTQSNLNKWCSATPPSGMVLLYYDYCGQLCQYLGEDLSNFEVNSNCQYLKEDLFIFGGGLNHISDDACIGW